MYKYSVFLALLLGGCWTRSNAQLTWTVVGAGPAGVITVSTLLDYGVPYDHIFWVDPTFALGRLGTCYARVPANSSVAEFRDLLETSDTFLTYLSNTHAADALYALDPAANPRLEDITQPMCHILQELKHRVHSHTTYVQQMQYTDGMWTTYCIDGTQICSDHIILATGARPRLLDYGTQRVIPLDIAIDKEKLAQCIGPDDTIGVVGSSHSAVLLLKHLYELGVQRIINLHTKPLLYAYDDGTHMIRPASGLKGDTAAWAHEVLERQQPHTITRVQNTPDNRKQYLPQCNAVIYAAGFTRNPVPIYTGTDRASYDGVTGIIAPGLFGIGVAFPEQRYDSVGNLEYLVGLNSFQRFARRIIPYWMSQPAVPECSKEYMPELIIDW